MTNLHPGAQVEARGDAPAVIMAGSGEVVTYAELEERSRRVAQLLHAAGLRPGDHIAIMMENHPRYFEIFWGAQRSGLYTTPINWHLKADEAGYIVEDCGAAAVFVSAALKDVAAELADRLGNVPLRLMVASGDDTADHAGVVDGFDSYEAAIAAQPAEPLEEEVEGTFMFYSSGTTGRPKGIRPGIVPAPYGSGGGALIGLIQMMYGFTSDTMYLCPAPLYHAAPLGWSTTAQRLGATVVVMEKFEPLQCLELIEKHRITHAQFVPTHFIRMLKLSEEERNRYDHSSLSLVVHAAAPCPAEVKRQMIEWWGPIINEYYAGSEGNGFCALNSAQALAHPGSVGMPLMGKIHICDEEGVELPIGEPGQIWFESELRFEYHNDPEKTASAYNDQGWSSLGDIGYLDAEGFLYLTDRASHMIISGGVNIYPQEVENELSLHPKVSDVAVIGVPNEDLGEEVRAVVIAADPAEAGDELAAELIAYCRSRLAHYKCPTAVDFVTELPRLPTGKLLKRELRDRYWPS
jgi:long-chain acyl-CoA synthetase